MWEEHPAYQKAQAKVIGLLVVLLFIASVIYCVSNRDWDLLRFVLYAGGSLVGGTRAFSLGGLASRQSTGTISRESIQTTARP